MNEWTDRQASVTAVGVVAGAGILIVALFLVVLAYSIDWGYSFHL